MPQDTTINLYYDGENFTVSSSKDSAEAEMAKLIREHWQTKNVQRPYIPSDKNKQQVPLPTVLLILGCMVFVIYKLNNRLQPFLRKYFGEYAEVEEENEEMAAAEPAPKVLVYQGEDLHFSDDEMVKVLNKYFPYYTKLGYDDKLKFFHRLRKFISEKTFVIHDESGFKEMPMLISASAVQISFGLDKYLLPHFSHIHIFPEEFIGYHPTFRLLEGNVSGHSINLSWKHFLNGYKFPDNGQNVGLHEFAHAFYYQYFEAGENVEHDFVARFPLFDSCGNKAFHQEQQPGNDLYSEYALTNFQEFWAESVEVFFEKPVLLKAIYPDLFEAMTGILKQDPIKLNSV